MWLRSGCTSPYSVVAPGALHHCPTAPALVQHQVAFLGALQSAHQQRCSWSTFKQSAHCPLHKMHNMQKMHIAVLYWRLREKWEEIYIKRSTNIRCLYGYNEKIPKGTESRVKGKNKNHLINTERRIYLREVVRKRYFYGQEIGPKFSHLLTFAFPNQMDICVDHLFPNKDEREIEHSSTSWPVKSTITSSTGVFCRQEDKLRLVDTC